MGGDKLGFPALLSFYIATRLTGSEGMLLGIDAQGRKDADE